MPLNPPPPPPTKTEEARLVVAKTAYRYRRAIKVILAAAAWASVTLLLGVPAAAALAGALAFLTGAYVATQVK